MLAISNFFYCIITWHTDNGDVLYTPELCVWVSVHHACLCVDVSWPQVLFSVFGSSRASACVQLLRQAASHGRGTVWGGSCLWGQRWHMCMLRSSPLCTVQACLSKAQGACECGPPTRSPMCWPCAPHSLAYSTCCRLCSLHRRCFCVLQVFTPAILSKLLQLTAPHPFFKASNGQMLDLCIKKKRHLLMESPWCLPLAGCSYSRQWAPLRCSGRHCGGGRFPSSRASESCDKRFNGAHLAVALWMKPSGADPGISLSWIIMSLSPLITRVEKRAYEE